MKIFTYENGPFMVNSYLVVNEAISKGFVIDPGNDLYNMITDIEKEKISIEAVICTHGHIDHVAGVSEIKEKYNVPFYINEKDKDLIDSLPVYSRMFGVPVPVTPVIDKFLPDSGEIEIAGIKLKLLYTPGHSPGSISFYTNNIVFSGDALFNMSIGRTDLPGGDYGQLITSIKSNLLTLPDETRVLSGHGPESTIGYEKKVNPFLR
jgi:hydroxyacylglutathione hydrolase